LPQEFDIVVAGGGVAGLTAARLGRKTLVVTGDMLGGLLVSIETVEGVPGFIEGIPGYDLGPMIQEQASAAGAEFTAGSVQAIAPQDGGWHIRGSEGEVQARAVVIATGATLKELEVPGAERLRGKGVSHCATCDGPLLRNRTVAVVGGGDSALQEALTLANFAERVIVLARGGALTAQATYRERAAASRKIEIRLDTVVEEVLGDETVSGLRIRNTAANAASDLEAAAVFAYIGLQPATAFLQDLQDRLQRDPSGCIMVGERMRARPPGLFAAGIARAGSAGRAAASAGDGATAAVAADRYLSDGDW
jgi:thioredoxin reductase (NADPH)